VLSSEIQYSKKRSPLREKYNLLTDIVLRFLIIQVQLNN